MTLLIEGTFCEHSRFYLVHFTYLIYGKINDVASMNDIYNLQNFINY